jgi:GPN-loop GTPase
VRNTKSLVFIFPLSHLTYPRPLCAREYLPELARVRAQREATLQKKKEDSTARMLADLAVDRASNPNFAAQDRWNPDEEEQEEEDDGGELNIIDKSASISGNKYIFRLSFRL